MVTLKEGEDSQEDLNPWASVLGTYKLKQGNADSTDTSKSNLGQVQLFQSAAVYQRKGSGNYTASNLFLTKVSEVAHRKAFMTWAIAFGEPTNLHRNLAFSSSHSIALNLAHPQGFWEIPPPGPSLEKVKNKIQKQRRVRKHSPKIDTWRIAKSGAELALQFTCVAYLDVCGANFTKRLLGSFNGQAHLLRQKCKRN